MTQYIADEAHFKEVIARVPKVKRSLWIGTADILERLRPEIAIGRIVSSIPPRFTEAPWGLLRQDGLMRALISCLNGRNSFQGRLYSPTTATP